MQCNEMREQLTLLVYDELDEHAAATVRSHVQQCDDCRRALHELQSAQQNLDAWPDVTASEPVGAVLDRIAEEDGIPMVVTTLAQPRRRRLTPWLVSAAAGLALALTVLAVGANIHSSNGQLTISFGRADVAESQPADIQSTELTEAQIEQLRAMFTNYGDRQASFALDAVDQRLGEFESAQDDQFLALVHTIRAMREEDLQRIEQALTVVALDSKQQTEQTRAALDDVVRTMAMRSPATGNYTDHMNVKEIIP